MLRTTSTDWHEYNLEWGVDEVRFYLDGELSFSTNVVPKGKMGLVIWVDNQFAAYPPGGNIRMGTLKTDLPICLEISNIEIQ